MSRSAAEASLVQTAIALAIALVLAPAVRGVTVELNHSVGRVWPFSHAHCHMRATPGCETELTERFAAALPARTGRATR